MPQRKRPPIRMSISQPMVVKPCGPHQRAMCSGWVHALNTRARGASIRRVTTSSRSAVSMLAGTAFVLGLQVLQVALQAIEALLPEHPVMVEPVGGALQWVGVQAAGAPLR